MPPGSVPDRRSGTNTDSKPVRRRQDSGWPGHQSVGVHPIPLTAGRELRPGHCFDVTDNMDTQLYYRPPNRPGFDTTADLLEIALGKRSGFAESRTSRHGAETSEGQSEQSVPLMTAWEIKQLEDDELFVFHRGVTPFKATRMDHRVVENLRKRYKLEPPVLPVLPLAQDGLLVVNKTSKGFTAPYIDPDRRSGER